MLASHRRWEFNEFLINPAAGGGSAVVRRLLAQFGIATLAVAMTTGLALADSQGAAPNAPTNNSDHSATVSAPGNVTVSTTDSNNQSGTTAGPSDNSGTPGGTVASTPNPPAVTGLANELAPADSAVQASTTGNQLLGGPAGSSAPPPTTLPQITPPSDGTAGGPAGQASPAVIQAAVHQAAIDMAAAQVHPVLLAATAPAMPQSNTPHSPLGFMHQLPFLMSQVVVPAAAHAFSALTIPAAAVAAALVFLIAAFSSLTTGSPSSYTARLRRSGFLGAARSDVGDAAPSFATPREMSFISTYVT